MTRSEILQQQVLVIGFPDRSHTIYTLSFSILSYHRFILPILFITDRKDQGKAFPFSTVACRNTKETGHHEEPRHVITGAWSGTDALANCNKVEHDKISKQIGKLTQERNFFENIQMSVGVTC